MRFAFVVHNLVRGNGQGRIQYEIAAHALRRGHSVTLVADAVAPELIDCGAQCKCVHQIPRRPNLLGSYRFASLADQVVSSIRDQFDVIVAAGFTMRTDHDVSLCQFVHGAWGASPVHVSRVTRGPGAWYQRLYTQCNARWELGSYSVARVVVAPSEKIRQELQGVGVPAERIEVIYNGVDLEEFKPGNVDRETLGLPHGKSLALFVGDIRTPRKNLDSILKALRRLPDLCLVVVGALQGSPFPALARKLGVSDRVFFTGFCSNVARYMQACDLFVFPSRYEAGTLVLTEALASGLPVVTARTAGGCEVMSDDCGVILDDPDDIDGLTAGIARFVGNPALRASASAAARATAEKHSWTSMAEHYLDLFSRMSESRRSFREPVPA